MKEVDTELRGKARCEPAQSASHFRWTRAALTRTLRRIPVCPARGPGDGFAAGKTNRRTSETDSDGTSRASSARGGGRLLAGTLLAAALQGAGAESFDEVTEIEPFLQNLAARHTVDSDRARQLLREAVVQQRVLDVITRPAEAKPWRDYRPIFLQSDRAEKGVRFWRQHRALLDRAEAEFGVPAGIVVAIIGVETFYGSRTGNLRVLDSLATLAFRYPRRSPFFTSELEHFLLLVEEEGLDPRSVKGSYAGAMGIPQFISSSYRNYAIDFDGDARRDLIANAGDAIGSVASYLERHGWRADEAVAFPATADAQVRADLLEAGLKPHTALSELEGVAIRGEWNAFADRPGALIELEGEQGPEHWVVLDNFYAITRYNHSKLYAMAVFQLAEWIRRDFKGGNE